jgi:hypothetical protein
MRTVVEWLLGLLLPASGTRRADTARTVPPEPSHPLPDRPRPLVVIDGHATPLVRPYLVQHERKRERQAQRERRTALVLATAGIDYQGLSA